MIENYLKVAIRNLAKHKAYSLINITGLAIGIACSSLIFLWVQDELSFDMFHPNADQIYRITSVLQKDSPSEQTLPYTAPPVAAALQRQFPEIEKAVSLRTNVRMLFTHDGESFEEKNGYYAGPEFFEMFDFPFVEGNPSLAFAEPYSLILSEQLALKYFRDGDAVGKTLNVDGRFDVTVSGVFNNLPANSSMQFDYVLPLEFARQAQNEPLEDWGAIFYQTFVRLQAEASSDSVGQKIARVYDDAWGSGEGPDLGLQPLLDLHLLSPFQETSGDILYVRIFSMVAFFVLLIACINFVNLATARSAHRAKEVGLRKVVGAHRTQLFRQFLGESVLFSLLALGLAVLGVELALPWFNQLSGKALSVDVLMQDYVLVLLGVTLLTGLISGGYPAFFLSAFQPAKVLRGRLSGALRGASLRRILVVTQFAFSTMLIVGTLVVQDQLSFIRNKKLGYDRENLIRIDMRGDLDSHYPAFRDELLRIPNVSAVAASSQRPTRVGLATYDIDWQGRAPEHTQKMIILGVDGAYLPALGFEIAAGRIFAEEFITDVDNYVVNETAVQVMQMAAPVGKTFSLSGESGQIIGVVKDFHFKTVRTKIEPMVLTMKQPLRHVLVKYTSGNAEDVLTRCAAAFRELESSYPFSYSFVDQDFDNLYTSETRLGTVVRYFTLLAVLISSLGLFGLASYSTEQRTKEIGIRKVLGASVGRVILTLSGEFAKLVALANLVAWPVAYWGMATWLQNFAYRTDLGVGAFLLAGGIALGLAMLTLSFQALKAALANPIVALKSE